MPETKDRYDTRPGTDLGEALRLMRMDARRNRATELVQFLDQALDRTLPPDEQALGYFRASLRIFCDAQASLREAEAMYARELAAI